MNICSFPAFGSILTPELILIWYRNGTIARWGLQSKFPFCKGFRWKVFFFVLIFFPSCRRSSPLSPRPELAEVQKRCGTPSMSAVPELNGQTMLLYSQIGFWYDLCMEKLPDTRFLVQDEYEALGELVQAAAF